MCYQDTMVGQTEDRNPIWEGVLSCSVVSNSYNPIDYSLLCSSVYGILQARILEWFVISFSRGSSWPRDQTQVFCMAVRLFTKWAMREALFEGETGKKEKAAGPKQVQNPARQTLSDIRAWETSSVVWCSAFETCWGSSSNALTDRSYPLKTLGNLAPKLPPGNSTPKALGKTFLTRRNRRSGPTLGNWGRNSLAPRSGSAVLKNSESHLVSFFPFL